MSASTAQLQQSTTRQYTFQLRLAISQRRNQSAVVNPNAGQIAAGSVGQELSRAGAQISRRNLNLQVTIKFPAGSKFNVRVNGDILFDSPYEPLDARPQR